ncbi:MAG: hypothetical protein RR014_02710 [Bilophila sp.]
MEAAGLVDLCSGAFQRSGYLFRFGKTRFAAQDGADHLVAVANAGVGDHLPVALGVVVVAFGLDPDSGVAQGFHRLAHADACDFKLNPKVSVDGVHGVSSLFSCGCCVPFR